MVVCSLACLYLAPICAVLGGVLNSTHIPVLGVIFMGLAWFFAVSCFPLLLLAIIVRLSDRYSG